MATNPMQRKARNSVLLGILIGLLIGAVIIAVLFMQLTKLQQERKEIQAATRSVYVFKNDVKSGTKVDPSMLILTSAQKDVVPSDYLGLDSITEDTIAKIDISKGTVLSKTVINESTEKTTDDLREQQYNMVVLPQYLDVNDYIDIRLTLPNGQDYIVVSKKLIKNISEDTIWINMYEEETVTMSNAIVEAYVMEGAKLYAARYVEPGLQTSATPTFVPSARVINLINSDKNIREEAKRALAERYTAELRTRREQDIENELNKYADQAMDNIESNLEEEITKSQEARKQYLDTLNAEI